MKIPSGAESFRGTSLGLCRLCFATPRWRVCFERAKQSIRRAGYFIDRGHECAFVGLRRFAEAADLPHELKRGGANFFVGYGRLKLAKDFDISAHSIDPAM